MFQILLLFIYFELFFFLKEDSPGPPSAVCAGQARPGQVWLAQRDSLIIMDSVEGAEIE